MSLDEAYSLPIFDNCIITVVRGMCYMHPAIASVIRSKIKNKIYCMCENNKVIGSEDVLLCMIGKMSAKCIQTYWGCDLEMLKPKKEIGKINILLDHEYYGSRSSTIFQKDISQRYVDSILAYQKVNDRVIANQIGSGGVFQVKEGYQIPMFIQAAGLDFRLMYENYNKADLFLVTHPGSFGFSIVETAAAGALIVAPKDYVHPFLLDKIHHVIIDPDDIDWDKVLGAIDVELSMTKARMFSYENLARDLHKALEG